MSDFIPKIGELIVIQQGHFAWNNNGKMDKFVGEIHKFIGGSDEHNCFAKPTTGMNEWCWMATAGHFRKPTLVEEIQYYSNLGILPKVGDKVILKEDNNWNGTMKSTYRNVSAIVVRVKAFTFRAGSFIGNDFGWDFKGYELDTSTPATSPCPSEPKEGDLFDVLGYEGILKKGEEGFYWSCPYHNDLIGFSEKKLRKREFSRKILGYFDYNSDAEQISARTIIELVRLLTALNDYIPESDPSLEFETSWEDYNIEDDISVNGQGCVLQKDDLGNYPYYLSCEDPDELFDPITEKLGMDRWEFQKTVLGYRDPNEYSFPQCFSLRDLMKFIEAIKYHYSPKLGVGDSITIDSRYGVNLHEGDTYILTGLSGRIIEHCNLYHWRCDTVANDTPFLIIGKNPRDFQYEILGYRDGSVFPECKSLHDLQIFLNAIETCWNTTTLTQADPSMKIESAITPNLGISTIIFINVPKI